MNTVDHVLALTPQASGIISDDWYALHARLYGALGTRVDGDGDDRVTNWQFALDPRAIASDPTAAPRYVVVRSSPAVAAPIVPVSVHSEETAVAGEGERIRFFLNVSGKKRRLFVAGEEAVRLEGVDRFKRVDLETATDLLRENGVEPEGEVEGPFTHRFVFQPGRRAKILKHGVVIAGYGRVADVGKLAHALEHGVGRDRTFGFGLLVVEAAGGRA